LSRVFLRVGMFEQYAACGVRISGDGEDSDNKSLLKVISDAIYYMDDTYPEAFNLTSYEYRSLWTSKFNCARRCGQWTEAYDACFKELVERKREEHLRALVKNMVDNGGLIDLIRFCRPFRTTESGEFTDLYPIAFEVLLRQSMEQDNYDARAASSNPAGITDYLGALYALNASQLQWQRAAQTLSLRYLKAVDCLQAQSNRFDRELRDTLIVGDLVLAACGAVNSIMLVKDPMARFVTSGEFSWYSAHVPNNPGSHHEENLTVDGTGAHNFVSSSLLEGIAVRAIGLRTMFLDSLPQRSTIISLFREDLHRSKPVFCVLFQSGYYQKGLMLVQRMSEYYRELNGSSKKNGVEFFGGIVSDLLKDLLIPLSFAAPDEGSSRPTLLQLLSANNSLGETSSTAFYVVVDRSVIVSSLPDAARNMGTLTLIKDLTCKFSSAETPIALAVATCILQEHDDARVPVWLERLLVGADVVLSKSGAFAPRPVPGCQKYRGNPQALLALYIREGLFLEACNLVTAVLEKQCTRVQSARDAPMRLPTKGDIDYVPQKSIDVLYNLIEITTVDKNLNIIQEREKLTTAREKMLRTLQKYVDVLKDEGLGILSARTLQQ
jgi:hypothetical protein